MEIIWADGAIQKEWLQVTVNANANTNLASPDVFYFGNAVGDSGNSTTDANVNTSDSLGARGHSTTSAGISNVYDFNKDGMVNAADTTIAQQNGTAGAAALQLISAPAIVIPTMTPIVVPPVQDPIVVSNPVPVRLRRQHRLSQRSRLRHL